MVFQGNCARVRTGHMIIYIYLPARAPDFKQRFICAPRAPNYDQTNDLPARAPDFKQRFICAPRAPDYDQTRDFSARAPDFKQRFIALLSLNFQFFKVS